MFKVTVQHQQSDHLLGIPVETLQKRTKERPCLSLLPFTVQHLQCSGVQCDYRDRRLLLLESIILLVSYFFHRDHHILKVSGSQDQNHLFLLHRDVTLLSLLKASSNESFMGGKQRSCKEKGNKLIDEIKLISHYYNYLG